MKNIFRDRVFWIFFLLVAGFIFLITTSGSQVYQAKARILLMPKNEVAARNINQIIKNARQIPLSLSFYDKIVELNSDIVDGASSLPDAQRKDFWNGKIQTKQIEKSGIVEISIFDSSQFQAGTILSQTVTGIVTVMNNYYGGKNNLDLRVIDGPIMQETMRLNYLRIVLFSLVGGALAGFVIRELINFLVGAFSRQSVAEAENEPVADRPSFFPKFSFPEMGAKKVADTEKKEKVFDFKMEDEEALVQPKRFGFFASKEKKSFAPSNLPVAEEFDLKEAVAGKGSVEIDLRHEENLDIMEAAEDEFVLDMGGARKESSQGVPEAVSVDHKREATPEEVKMRLNKLLSGK